MKDSHSYKLGIFDSGKGGLSVVKELFTISNMLPVKLNVTYLSDFKNFPYGKKTQSQLESIIEKNLYELYLKGNETIIVACNTASIAGSDVYSRFMKDTSAKVFKVTDGIFSAYHKVRAVKKVLVIATEYTVKSGYYETVLAEMNDKVKVLPSVEQDFVAHIEAEDSILVKQDVARIAQFAEEKGCDAILLGCTHYSFVKDQIKEQMPDITILDPSHLVSLMFMHRLINEQIESGDVLNVPGFTNEQHLKHYFIDNSVQAASFAERN